MRIIIGAAGILIGHSPVFAQTFRTYNCYDGSQFIIAFFEGDKRAHLQLDGKATTLPKRISLSVSSTPFPGHQYCLDWRREESGGNIYYAAKLDMEGWLCPALLKYFPEAPKQLYVQTKGRSSGAD